MKWWHMFSSCVLSTYIILLFEETTVSCILVESKTPATPTTKKPYKRKTTTKKPKPTKVPDSKEESTTDPEHDHAHHLPYTTCRDLENRTVDDAFCVRTGTCVYYRKHHANLHAYCPHGHECCYGRGSLSCNAHNGDCVPAKECKTNNYPLDDECDYPKYVCCVRVNDPKLEIIGRETSVEETSVEPTKEGVA